MVFLLPLIGVVGPFGDQGLGGGYVPFRARLLVATALLPGALLGKKGGGGSYMRALGRFPVKAFLYRLGDVSLAVRGPLWCPATPRDGLIPVVVQTGGNGS